MILRFLGIVLGFLVAELTATATCADPSFGLFGNRQANSKVTHSDDPTADNYCNQNPLLDPDSKGARMMGVLDRGRTSGMLSVANTFQGQASFFTPLADMPADWPSACLPPDCSCSTGSIRTTEIYTNACNIASGNYTKPIPQRADSVADNRLSYKLAGTLFKKVKEFGAARYCKNDRVDEDKVANLCAGNACQKVIQDISDCYCGNSDSAICRAHYMQGLEKLGSVAPTSTVPKVVDSSSSLESLVGRGTAGICAPEDHCTGCSGPAGFLQCIATFRHENLSAQAGGFNVKFSKEKIIANATEWTKLCNHSLYYQVSGACSALWHIASEGYKTVATKTCAEGRVTQPENIDCPRFQAANQYMFSMDFYYAVATEPCGNNIVDTGEECDAGWSNGGAPAECSSLCKKNVPVCGNGIWEQGEQCDSGEGNGVTPAWCSSQCTMNQMP